MREFRERMKRVVIYTVNGCYRSICNHPFLGVMSCFLVFLYRSYPFMFSVLVSASPVLACTAILLGTLLSFGEPNIPEIEREERTTNEIVSSKTGVSENNVVFDTIESVSVERYGDKEKDTEDVDDQFVKETSFVANAICRDCSDGSFSRLLEKRSKEIESDDNLELESESELFEERLANHYSLFPDVDDEHDLENDRSPTCSVDSKMVNVDCLDSPPCTPWRYVNQEDEDDEAFDSGSDRAESSSPDASMADILPVIDELYPLLDEDAPRPLNLSYDGSDTASEQSAISDESSDDSIDDTENEVSEFAEDGKDGDDEEETQGEEDQTKSAITWTEEDERNLMDLGSSELERNQRLENLVARRRGRKTMSVEPETNLIDLESTDLTFDVPSISTTRKNPFDVSHDSYKNMGLPPIPGSAPSVLLHCRNPFDIPYDSSEEKPDLKEDSFEQEFTPLQSKEHFMRRHESFNAWRTPFGNDRREKKDMTRFRPYFVAESLDSEEIGYSRYQRQLSGLSVASSVPDTGSDGWSEDTERWYVSEEGTFANEEMDNVDDEIIQELDRITLTEHAYELAGHGSESSEEENSIELDQLEKRRMTNDETDMKLEDNQEAKSSIVVEQRLENQFDISLTNTNSNIEGHEQSYGNISSSSSLSEESERVYVEKVAEEYPSFIDGLYQQHEEPSTSAQASVQGSHLTITATLEDNPIHRDPIYDLSLLDVRQTISRSSNDFEFANGMIKKSVSFSEIVTVIGTQEMESDSSDNEEIFYDSSEIIQADEREIMSSSDESTRETMEMTKHNNVNYEFSEEDKISASASKSGVPRPLEIADQVNANYVSSERDTIFVDAISSDVPETLEETPMYENATSPNVTNIDTYMDDIQSLSMSCSEINLDGFTEKLDFADTQCKLPISMQTGQQNFDGSKEALESENVERGSPAPLNMLSHNIQSIVDHKGESILSEEGIIQSSFDLSDNEDKTPTPRGHPYPFAESSGSQSVEEVLLSHNSFNKPYLEDQKEALESEFFVKSFQEEICADSYSNYDIPQIDNKLSLALEVLSNDDFIAVPPVVLGCQAVDEIDEIKEIDEQLLEELDNVGDFRVNEFREVDDHVEFGSQVSHVQHDGESPLALIDENPTRTYATEQHTVELGSAITEFDQYDEDMKHASEFNVYKSPVHPIETSLYDGKGLDDSDLELAKENTYSNAKESDINVNSLEESSDLEENNTLMADIEAHFAKTTEAMISKTELIQAQSGAVHLDHPPCFVDLPLEENITSGSESIETDKTQGQANIHMLTLEFQDSDKDLDLDINQPLEDNVEHVLISGSMLSAEGATDSEGSCLQLLASESHSLNDSSDLVLKQESESSSSEALGYSEDGTAKDVQVNLDILRESNSCVIESHVQNNLQNPYESDMVEAKLQESDDVLISERKFLDDSFSALKQESQSSPSEALKMSEEFRVNNYSEREAKSGAEDHDEKRTHHHSLEEPYSAEAKTPKSHDVLISEIESLNDSDLALKQESSFLGTVLKLFEDGLDDNVRADTDSKRDMKSTMEESDVEDTQKYSSGEPKFVEVKTPESRDVTVSDIGNHINDTDKKRLSSSSSDADRE